MSQQYEDRECFQRKYPLYLRRRRGTWALLALTRENEIWELRHERDNLKHALIVFTTRHAALQHGPYDDSVEIIEVASRIEFMERTREAAFDDIAFADSGTVDEPETPVFVTRWFALFKWLHRTSRVA